LPAGAHTPPPTARNARVGGDATHLFRIAPGGGGSGFQVEYTFECACGENTVLNEADLPTSRT
jgi:hypothetical protein